MAELGKTLERLDSRTSGVSWVVSDRQTMFSDAVFSIVATIMVVTIEISESELNEVSHRRWFSVMNFSVCPSIQ